MADTLLRSLREVMLDESEPLAGLLRKCLVLGSETGSVALRDWARKELNGYGDDDEVPRYRYISPSISAASQSGRHFVTGQTVHRLQMPQECWEYVEDSIPLKQPVEELARLATGKRLSISSGGLSLAQALWNKKLGAFQEIIDMRYVTSADVVAGIVGQIRTQLVDLIADLTADTPLAELPRKEQVDAAVGHRIGRDIYNTTIHQADGPVAIGAKATASTEGLTVGDALLLLDKVHEVAGTIEADQRTDLDHAVTELRAALAQDTPDAGEVVKKAGRLRQIANTIGTPSLIAAVGGVAQALTELAMSGAFG